MKKQLYVKIRNIYSIYDKVAKEYGPTFQAVNDGVAIRQMEGLLYNPQSPSLFANEYLLVKVATTKEDEEGLVVHPHKMEIIEVNLNTEVTNE